MIPPSFGFISFVELPTIPCHTDICWVGPLYWEYLFWWLFPYKIYEAKWWAGMYGAPTWKRHIAWSGSPTVQCLDLGKLCAKYKALIKKYGVKSTKQYQSKAGKSRFAGSKALKATGFLGPIDVQNFRYSYSAYMLSEMASTYLLSNYMLIIRNGINFSR